MKKYKYKFTKKSRLSYAVKVDFEPDFIFSDQINCPPYDLSNWKEALEDIKFVFNLDVEPPIFDFEGNLYTGNIWINQNNTGSIFAEWGQADFICDASSYKEKTEIFFENSKKYLTLCTKDIINFMELIIEFLESDKYESEGEFVFEKIEYAKHSSSIYRKNENDN